MTSGLVAIAIIAILVSGIVRLARIRAGTDHLYIGRKGRRGGVQNLLDPAQPSPRELELQREVVDLRTRIHVLERIATDGRQTRELADEIESLRGR